VLKKLGKYEVLGELGHGAMGVVYRARDPVINRQVALKTITAGIADDPSMLERFYREAQSAGGLQHPNIVTIYDMGDERGVPYIAMELVDGENLDQLISRRAPIPLPLKIVYTTQACNAFDYAHKRGIIHRDIKPGNVMVNKDGTVKVVDFGIARVLEASRTQTGMLLGTFAYMSPEQYHGEHADERSDIWSFGVLLYELLCFQKPFTGTTPAALMHSICSKEAPSLRSACPDAPEELEALMCKLLQKSPDDRFQSMEDVLLRLDPICKNLQVASVAEMLAQSRDLVEQGEYTHARDLLRQALLIDSGNSTGRALLEKVNTELRRVMIRPKAQLQVDKGKALLEEGKIDEAKAAADSALQMDSSFLPAQELRNLVQQEIDRVQRVADWLDGAKQLIAEGMPEDAEMLLVKVLDAEPSNKGAGELKQEALKQRAERKRRLELIEKMQAARSLWTQQKYAECIEILTELQKEYPEEEEIPRLLQTAREDQAEEERKQNLEKARNLLAARRYAECRLVLSDLQRAFPDNEEVVGLLQHLQEDEANQQKLQKLIEARSLLASRAFDECILVLSVLEKEHPGDDEIKRLVDTARRERVEEQKKHELAKARMLMASRQYQECTALLEDLKKQFPADVEIPRLLGTVVEEKREQRRLEALAEARKLLAAHQHKECITLLTSVKREFPGNADVENLLKTAHEDEAEQRKIQTLVKARDLLAARSFDESIALLTELQRAFPKEDEIARLLETAREEQAEQRKQQKLVEARSLFVAERFDDALKLLEGLGAAHPKDAAIQKLRAAVLQEKQKHAQAEKLKNDIAELKKLVSEKKYPEVLAKADKLLAEHPSSADLARLVEFSRGQQAEIERELAVRKAVNEAKSLLKANRFDEALRAIDAGLAAHADNRELITLREQVETQRKKTLARQEIEQRIKEIKVKINREKFSEAIALADETIATIGPNTDVNQLRKSAQVEIAAREKKRDQEKTIESIRLLVESGKLDDATQTLDAALAKKLFDPFDSRTQRAAEEIAASRNAAKKEPSPSEATLPPNFTKEYAFLQKPPELDTPPTPENVTSMEAPESRASVTPPVISGSTAASPAVEPPQSKEPAQVSQPGAGQPITPTTREYISPVKQTEPAKAAEPAKPVKPPGDAKPTTPTVPAETSKAAPSTRPAAEVKTPPLQPSLSERVEPKHHKATEKKKPLVAAALALAAALAASGAYFLWPKLRTEVKTPVAVSTKPSTPVAPPNPLEIKQREAINAAEKLVATNDLENALQTVTEAEKLNGPLTADLQKIQGQIEDSIKDTRLRQVRQREAQLWQQAADKMKSQRYGEAQNYMRQVLALPEGGVHRDEAQRNLSEVIPRLQQQGKFLAQAQQALRQGDFGSARSFAAQVQRSGGDTSQLNGEIDKSEADRLVQLENEFRQLKDADNDAAVQQLSTLQPKFKAVAGDGGPKSGEAQTYFENTATAISDVQSRIQTKRVEAAFQSAVQKYQQALNTADKNALTSASGALQPFAQGGPHAGEAQKYLGEINARLAVLNKPAPPPVVEPPPVPTTKREVPPVSPVESDAGVRAVVQRYQEAFAQRDADALRQIWPTMGERYKKFKEGFGAAKSIQMKVEIVEVKMGADGGSATVRAVQTQNYTPKGGGKMMTSKDQTVFYMVKANGNWVITQLQ
jgi:tetratricopeptide (TPR) repeat protein